MVTKLPITKDEPLEISDLPKNTEDKFYYDLLNKFDWKIIPYDYDDESKTMCKFELYIEGRKIIDLNMDSYGDSWSLEQKNGTWFYQVILGEEVYDEYRYDLNELVSDVLLYQLEKYNKYIEVVDEYNNFTAWELFDKNKKILDIKEELNMLGSKIDDRYSIPDDDIYLLEKNIQEERKRLRKIDEKLDELENILNELK